MSSNNHITNEMDEDLSIRSQIGFNFDVYETVTLWREVLSELGSPHYYFTFKPEIRTDKCSIQEGFLSNSKHGYHAVHLTSVIVEVTSLGCFEFVRGKDSDPLNLCELLLSIPVESVTPSKAAGVIKRSPLAQEMMSADSPVCWFKFYKMLTELKEISRKRDAVLASMIRVLIPPYSSDRFELIRIKSSLRSEISSKLLEKFESENDCPYQELMLIKDLQKEITAISNLARKDINSLVDKYMTFTEPVKSLPPEPISAPREQVFIHERNLTKRSKGRKMAVNLGDIIDDPEDF